MITRFLSGSPPHTWRIPGYLSSFWVKLRITSTHVENTTVTALPRCQPWDHLHTRGEYIIPLAFNFDEIGSPPHTWRILYEATQKRLKYRITSTHVENTDLINNHTSDTWDHLHTRGEYYTILNVIGKIIGSPPHTWRIQTKYGFKTYVGRITSTHVENTVNKSQYNNNHKTIDPKISSLCQLLLYLFLSH